MSLPLEHDYIGLSDASSSSSSSSAALTAEEVEKSSNGLNLKETELRLGLPGSVSPDRNDPQDKCVYSFGLLKKRGFSDAVGGDGQWGYGGNGSEADFAKGGGLFSSRGRNSAVEELGMAPALRDGGLSHKGAVHEKKPQSSAANEPAAKAQVVGWPPIRSFRKNTMATNLTKNSDDADSNAGIGCMYVKVSMDGAPYLRKVDIRNCSNYKELSSALEKMFCSFTIGQCGSHGVPGRDGLNESRLMDLLHGSDYVLTYEDKDGDWMLVGDVPWEMFTASCKRLRIMKGSDAIGLDGEEQPVGQLLKWVFGWSKNRHGYQVYLKFSGDAEMENPEI